MAEYVPQMMALGHSGNRVIPALGDTLGGSCYEATWLSTTGDDAAIGGGYSNGLVTIILLIRMQCSKSEVSPADPTKTVQ